MATLVHQEGAVPSVQRTRLLLALGLRRSLLVRAIRGTVVTLHQAQAHAQRARQASTRVLTPIRRVWTVHRIPQVVVVSLGVTAMLVTSGCSVGRNVPLVLLENTGRLMQLPIPPVLLVLRTRLQLALGLRRSQHVRAIRGTVATLVHHQ